MPCHTSHLSAAMSAPRALLAMLGAVALLTAPHVWPVTTDAARAIHTLAYTALVWPIVMCDGAHATRIAATLLVVLGVVHHSLVLGINVGEYYAHVVPGVMLLRGGVIALRSRDGLPIPIGLIPGAVAVLILLAQATVQYYQTLRVQVTIAHLAHELAFLVVACVLLIGTLPQLLAAPRAARLREARRLLDPVAFAALGLLFLSHIHDKTAVGIGWHRVLGWALIAKGAVDLLAGCVHAHAPPPSAARLAKALVAFAWALPGVWLVHMAAFQYLFARGWHSDLHESTDVKHGVHHLLWPSEAKMDEKSLSDARENFAKAGEYLGIYLTVDLLLVASFVAAAIITGPLEIGDAEPRPPGRMVHSNACETAEDDGASLAPPADTQNQKRSKRGFRTLPSDDIP